VKRMIIIRPEHTHPDGVQICDEAAQKLGFHGATPTAQRANEAQKKLVCNLTAQSPTQELVAEIQSLVNLTNELRDALVEKGLIKGSE
jgi:hypothetical protein